MADRVPHRGRPDTVSGPTCIGSRAGSARVRCRATCGGPYRPVSGDSNRVSHLEYLSRQWDFRKRRPGNGFPIS